MQYSNQILHYCSTTILQRVIRYCNIAKRKKYTSLQYCDEIICCYIVMQYCYQSLKEKEYCNSLPIIYCRQISIRRPHMFCSGTAKNTLKIKNPPISAALTFNLFCWNISLLSHIKLVWIYRAVLRFCVVESSNTCVQP